MRHSQLIPCILYSQVPRSHADSLLAILKTSQPDTNLKKIWLSLSEYPLYKPGEYKADLDPARTFAEQAQALSHKLGNYRMEAKTLKQLGSIDLESKNFPQAIAFRQAATNLFSSPQ